MTQFLTLGASFPFPQSVGCDIKTYSYFELLLTLSTLHLDSSGMPKPVYLLTMQEAHKKYKSLTDLIQAKYEQLDSGEYGAVGTPAFNAEACELANLLVHVSQLCHLQRNCTGPHSSRIEDVFIF